MPGQECETRFHRQGMFAAIKSFDCSEPGKVRMNSVEPLTLTVIIVNRNTSRLLADCLSHVYRSDCTGKLQVIVVDNGSSDDSVRMVEANYPRFFS